MTTLPRVVRTFEEFAKVDVYTGDIDPVYFAIHRAAQNFGQGWATRFAVGMLTYYHTGTAAQAADREGQSFWDYIEEQYPTAIRAAERRHWRGFQGTRSLNSMKAFAPNPDKFFTQLTDAANHRDYYNLRGAINKHLIGFGEYFVLKICDYMDRCLGIPISNYASLENHLPGLPAQAANLLYPTLTVPEGFIKAYQRLALLDLKAPPLFDRPLGPAEVETILCDWKRAKYGNHIIGDDIVDKRSSLKGLGYKAERMREMFPREFPLDTFRCELE